MMIAAITRWIGMPSHCDVCGHAIGDFFYDAKLREGWWGLVCEQCFNRFGCGLGLGRGQKYDSKTGFKVEG
jgi:hypothetical protein